MKKVISQIYLIAFVSLFGLAQLTLAQDTSQVKGTVDITYAVGADLSFLKMAEDSGMVFKDEGVAKPGLEIFKDHGYNWIRLRLFHSPDRLPNDLDYTIDLAKEAQKRGYKFLLDYHYADSWADPGKQPIPEAWKGLSVDVLADSVYQYTKTQLRLFGRRALCQRWCRLAMKSEMECFGLRASSPITGTILPI